VSRSPEQSEGEATPVLSEAEGKNLVLGKQAFFYGLCCAPAQNDTHIIFTVVRCYNFCGKESTTIAPLLHRNSGDCGTGGTGGTGQRDLSGGVYEELASVGPISYCKTLSSVLYLKWQYVRRGKGVVESRTSSASSPGSENALFSCPAFSTGFVVAV
jgi:hypothetical protein